MNTVLNVSGMSCGGCVKHVTEALRGVPGVTKADVELRDGRATVEHTAKVEALIAAVREAGYEAALQG